ncbi:MAG: bacillithiol system redox-active protein YtxJ [Phaeodactylibacter sp.]|nr:bacillithiol system redox-active protein YtxJ [Phaeodactylibacter sp.]
MNKINWLPLTKLTQVEDIARHSGQKPCVIYKHSSRCSLSSLAQHRLEKGWVLDEPSVHLYFLDLIAHREVSNLVAERFGVAHQSPQLLLIRNGRCVYHASHLDISAKSLHLYLGDGQQA